MRVLDRVFKGIGVILLFFFVCAGAFFMALHTSWGKSKFFDFLTTALHESGWKVEAKEIQGNFLERLSLREIQINSPQGDRIFIGSLEVQFSPWKLFRREIAFSRFHADEIRWHREDAATASLSPQNTSNGMPVALSCSDLRLTTIEIPYSDERADLRGRLRIGRFNRTASFKGTATRRDVPGAALSASLQVRSDKTTELQIDLLAPTFAALSPWVSLPAIGKGDAHLRAKGPWSAFSLLFFEGTTDQSIQGSLFGTVSIIDTSFFSSSLANEGLKRAWTFSTHLELTPSREWRASLLSLKSASLSLTGDLALDESGKIKQASGQIACRGLQEAHLAPIEGPLVLQFNALPETLSASLSSPKLHWDGLSLEELQAAFQAKKVDNTWTGRFDLQARSENQPIEGHFNLLWPQNESVLLSDIALHSSLINITGQLEILPSHLLQGSLVGFVANVHELHPSGALYGPLEGTSQWGLSEENLQMISLDVRGKHLFLGPLQIEELHIYSDLIDPFHSLQGNLYADMQNSHYEHLLIETASLETDFIGENWPARIHLEGDWKGPLDLTMDGYWRYAHQTLLCNLQNLTGSLLFYPILLNAPVQLEWNATTLNVSDLSLNIGSASLLGRIDHHDNESALKIQLDRMPIDFLSLNPLELSVTGTIHLDAELSEKKGATEGFLQATFADVEIATLSENPVSGEAHIHASFEKELLSFDLDCQVENLPLMRGAAELPLSLSLFPFKAELLPEKRAKADFSFHGRVEKLLDFFDLGANHLEGDLNAMLEMKGPLKKPLLEGSVHFKNGVYENYYSGTQLTQVNADLVAHRHTLRLSSLTAKDQSGKGRLSLSGEVQALIQEHFPFQFDGEFSRLDVAEIDWLKAEAGGTLHIVGNTNSARVTGEAIILETDMSIPSRVPPSLPNLQVKYINLQKPLISSETLPLRKKPYPIFFDYQIHAPDGIFVSGRGLSSEWKGDFRLGGTYTDIEARGQLELLSGEFVFSSRAFSLSEGSLTFSGRPHEMPLLNLAARINLQTVAIIARLKGFLNAPQLSFQSIPPMPMGSILSYLLFGEDLSNISAIQAAQLVTSISSFASESGDVFDTTRRSLGVDRFRIVATPLSDSGGETYALQVGKYVTRGVLVSVSQGTEGSSTNLGIEVDLVNGFVFEAESQREQEQGKFTIKWNWNY